MATSRVRESTIGLAKDKKAVSSTPSRPPGTKRTNVIATVKPRTATSSGVDRASLTSSEKQVPNSLKPTRASHTEPSISKSHSFSYAKKTGVHHDATASASSKPIVDRRRSFDRPPSDTRLQKAYVRSSSSLSSKPVIEKTSKSVSRDAKPQASSSRTKSNAKSTIPSHNKETRHVASKLAKSTAEHATPSNSEAKSELDHQELSLEKAVQVDGDHNKVEVPTQGLKSDENSCCSAVSEHEQHDDVYAVDSDQYENGGDEAERVIPMVSEELTRFGVSIVSADQEDCGEKAEALATEIESGDAGGVKLSNENAEEEENKEKHSPTASDEVKVGAIDEEGKESNAEQAMESVVETVDHDTYEGAYLPEIKFVTISTQKEVGDVNVVGGAEEKTETTSSEKSRGGSDGRKESPVYNDMIEETKKKLMDKSRANRVKALVGAFQSVIEHESESASK